MTSRYIMTTRSQDRVGIVAALTTCLANHDGFINEQAQFGTPSSEEFFSRIQFTIDEGKMPSFREALSTVCEAFGLSTQIIPVEQKTRVLVMVSKFDHCLNDILYRYRSGMFNIEIPAIISNHEVLKPIAEMAGVPFHYIPVSKDTKPEAEARLRELIDETGSNLIVLARYMQILSEEICAEFSGRVINIHHSFLPSFKGAMPYHRAHERGVKLIGATAHYVTSNLDEGPIIEQSVQRVNHAMEVDELVAMGRDVEAQTLSRAIKLHTEHRAFINGRKTVILP